MRKKQSHKDYEVLDPIPFFEAGYEYQEEETVYLPWKIILGITVLLIVAVSLFL